MALKYEWAIICIAYTGMRSFLGAVGSKVPYSHTLTSNFHERSISQHTIKKAATVKTCSAHINDIKDTNTL